MPPAPGPTTTRRPGGHAERSRNGELRAMVAKVLADTGTGLTPRAVAAHPWTIIRRGRQRLQVLAERGAAEVVSDHAADLPRDRDHGVVAAPTITPAPRTPPPEDRRNRPPATATGPPTAAAPPESGAAGVVTGPVKRARTAWTTTPGCCPGCRT